MFHLCEDEVREFSQAPFWFWNDELNEGEISRQLDEFQAHGVHAFVIHPRAGLPESLAWMSIRLLDYMRFAIAEAERRNMWVILYGDLELTQFKPKHRQCQFTWLLAQMWMRRISGGPLLCLRRPVKDTRQFQNFSSTMGQI